MEKETKSIPWMSGGCVCVVVYAIASKFGLQNLFAGLIGLVAGLAVAVYLIARSRKQDKKDVAKEMVQEVFNPRSTIEKLEELLFEWTEKLRTTDNVDPRMLVKMDEIADAFYEAIPEINNQYPDGTLTASVNRMVSEYIPKKFVTPYINLPLSQRTDDSLVEESIASTDGMMQELEETMQMVRNHRTADFEKKAKFLNVRFQ